MNNIIKKTFKVLLAIFMIISLEGCGNTMKEKPNISNIQGSTEQVAGGYVEAKDINMTPELIDIFNKAFEGYTDMNYSPVTLVATQVVAGTNYKFKADGIKTTEPMKQGIYYVYINKDLKGNVSLLEIGVIEEHEFKKFVPEVELDTELKIK